MTKSLVRTLAMSLVLSVLVLLGIGTAASARPPTADPSTAPVTGTLADGTGSVTGTFDVQRFVNQGGVAQAVGTFSGTITDAAGNTVSGTQSVTLPVDLAQSEGTCEILDLVLGPLDLNLLGLMVHLDQVHLNITAVEGPGNLLGNLLCAIAGLLDGPTNVNAVVQQIVNLLNMVLGVLR